MPIATDDHVDDETTTEFHRVYFYVTAHAEILRYASSFREFRQPYPRNQIELRLAEEQLPLSVHRFKLGQAKSVFEGAILGSFHAPYALASVGNLLHNAPLANQFSRHCLDETNAT